MYCTVINTELHISIVLEKCTTMRICPECISLSEKIYWHSASKYKMRNFFSKSIEIVRYSPDQVPKAHFANQGLRWRVLSQNGPIKSEVLHGITSLLLIGINLAGSTVSESNQLQCRMTLLFFYLCGECFLRMGQSSRRCFTESPPYF